MNATTYTPATITGHNVRLFDGREGVVISAFGSALGVDRIDVEVNGTGRVLDLGMEDVTVIHACPVCGGPTIPADPSRPEERGNYCDRCGHPYDAATGEPLL